MIICKFGASSAASDLPMFIKMPSDVVIAMPRLPFLGSANLINYLEFAQSSCEHGADGSAYVALAQWAGCELRSPVYLGIQGKHERLLAGGNSHPAVA
jgi:hypothetical protein